LRACALSVDSQLSCMGEDRIRLKRWQLDQHFLLLASRSDSRERETAQNQKQFRPSFPRVQRRCDRDHAHGCRWDVLVDQKKFREYFKQKISPDQDRWDAVHNKMTEHHLDELLTHLEILRAEISFSMAAIEIDDKRALEFLKRLSATLIRMRNTTLDYDSMKSLGGFLWEIFAGFNPVTGYQERDFFDDMIQAI
jgi:hypothetical protein